MENKKFNLLLHDVKSGKFNVNKIQILECYIAQRFTITQILLLTQPLTTSDAKLKGINLLVKAMLVCKTEEAICLISSLGTDSKYVDNQLICLEELLKHKKVHLDESEKHPLFSLFQGTTAEEEACKLLKITPQSISTHLPAQHQMPPAGASFRPRSRTPDQLPIASDRTPHLRQATTTTTETFSQYPQVKAYGTPDQPPHTFEQLPHTLQRSSTLGQYPYSISNTVPNPPTYHYSTPTYPPYQMYHHANSGVPVPQFPANGINPSAIGFIVPGDTPQTAFPNGPPPGLGFTVQL